MWFLNRGLCYCVKPNKDFERNRTLKLDSSANVNGKPKSCLSVSPKQEKHNDTHLTGRKFL